jgi:hypothetical protein
VTDDASLTYWLINFNEGYERVDKATVDEIERAVEAGKRTVWITALHGAPVLLFLDRIESIAESSSEARAADDRMRVAIRKEEIDRRLANGWTELLESD